MENAGLCNQRHGDQTNDRICQFRIFENMPTIQFDETASLDNENRGGFGSTGKTIDSSICTGTWINFCGILHSNYAGFLYHKSRTSKERDVEKSSEWIRRRKLWQVYH